MFGKNRGLQRNSFGKSNLSSVLL